MRDFFASGFRTAASRACSSKSRGRALPGLPPSISKTREITGYNPHRMDAHLGPHKLPNFKGYFVVQFRQAPAERENLRPGETETRPTSRGAFAEFGPAS